MRKIRTEVPVPDDPNYVIKITDIAAFEAAIEVFDSLTLTL